jgi:ABC-2 type transport system permease protein
MSSSLNVQIRTLAKRSIRRTLRQPVLVVPNVIFPLFMLAVLSSAGKEITDVKGFPTKSYITFIIAATLIQGAAGATTLAGNSLGNDIETGFLSRLALTPVKVPALCSTSSSAWPVARRSRQASAERWWCCCSCS